MLFWICNQELGIAGFNIAKAGFALGVACF
jgi:hypothetical protein